MDLPQMQQQIAAAGGTPGALETPAAGADATPGTGTTAEKTGSVTLRVYACPAEMNEAAGQGLLDQAALLAGCTPLDTPELAPTLSTLPDGEQPMAGTAIEPGVYDWDGLAFGDYVIGVSGEMPTGLDSLRVTDASGNPLQNPVLELDELSPHVEYFSFYFLVEGTPAA